MTPPSHLQAVLQALFATHEGPPDGDVLDWTSDRVLLFIERAGPRTRWPVLFALFYITWVVPLLRVRLPPFRRLPLTERVAALDKGERGLLSALYVVLKVVGCINYFEHPQAGRLLAWDPVEQVVIQ